MKKAVMFQGDSHVQYMDYAVKNNLLPDKFIYQVQSLPGATFMTHGNPNTDVNAAEQFKKQLQISRPNILVTHIGEIDCGFLVWYNRTLYNSTIEDQVIDSIENYVEYLKFAKTKVEHIIVTAPTMQVITDEEKDAQLRLQRGGVTASQHERSRITVIYSNILMEKCREHGFTFLNFNPSLMAGGILNRRFRSTTPNDFHLETSVVGPLWGKKLSVILNSLT